MEEEVPYLAFVLPIMQTRVEATAAMTSDSLHDYILRRMCVRVFNLYTHFYTESIRHK